MYTIWMGATNGRGCVVYAKNIPNWSDAVATLALYGSQNWNSRFRLTSQVGDMKLVIATGTGQEARIKWDCLVTPEQRRAFGEYVQAKSEKEEATSAAGHAWYFLQTELRLPMEERKKKAPVVVKKWEKERIKREAEIHAANESRAFEF